jgi:hypothetical protein
MKTRLRLIALCAALLTPPALAQTVDALSGTGAVLRTLDRVSGNVIDVEMSSGQTMAYGLLQITLTECRYPVDNPTGDAFAHLVVVDSRTEQDIFQGWMIASSPALMALDHPRYDVWVLRCTMS